MQSETGSEAADRLGTTLLAVARPMLPARPSLSHAERSEVEADLSEHLRGQIIAMPTHLRIPFAVALFTFDSLPLLRHLKTFRGIPPDAQTRIIARWSRSPIPQFRDLIKLVRSCALLAYLDHPIVRRRLVDASTGSEGRAEVDRVGA